MATSSRPSACHGEQARIPSGSPSSIRSSGKPDRAALANQVFLELLAATEALSYRAGRPLEAQSLSLPQFQVLRILRNATSEGLLVHEVGQRMVGRAPNITRLVDKLEARGLVTRSRGDSDRRTVRLELTSVGLGILESLEAPVEEEVIVSLEPLTDGDLAELRALLIALRGPGESAVGSARANHPPGPEGSTGPVGSPDR